VKVKGKGKGELIPGFENQLCSGKRASTKIHKKSRPKAAWYIEDQ